MNIYCLYPQLKNVDIIKTVGDIPYYLHQDYNYDSAIVAFNNESYPYIDRLDGVELDIIEKKYSINILNVIRYLKKNAKNIDVLRCLHYSIPTFTYFFFYKLFNRKGIVYFTIDTDYPTSLRLNGQKPGLRYKIETAFSVFLFKYLIDFATLETKRATNVFYDSNDIYKEKLEYVPPFINPDDSIVKEKKNQIISVGRIGSHQKASEIILEAYKKAMSECEDKWTLKMVGPISDEFNEYIDRFYDENHDLKENIIFTGNISNREKLYETYAESKIFLLPSRYGSFEIVFCEALFYDNYLLVSDIGVGDYIVGISEFGENVEIDNIEDISKKLSYAIKNYEELKTNCKIDHRQQIKDEFSPPKYIEMINRRLSEIKEEKR